MNLIIKYMPGALDQLSILSTFYLFFNTVYALLYYLWLSEKRTVISRFNWNPIEDLVIPTFPEGFHLNCEIFHYFYSAWFSSSKPHPSQVQDQSNTHHHLQTQNLDDRQVLGYVTVSPLPHNATGAESLDAGLRKPFKGDSMNVHEQIERALLLQLCN